MYKSTQSASLQLDTLKTLEMTRALAGFFAPCAMPSRLVDAQLRRWTWMS
jgi:hypothetical protein